MRVDRTAREAWPVAAAAVPAAWTSRPSAASRSGPRMGPAGLRRVPQMRGDPSETSATDSADGNIFRGHGSRASSRCSQGLRAGWSRAAALEGRRAPWQPLRAVPRHRIGAPRERASADSRTRPRRRHAIEGEQSAERARESFSRMSGRRNMDLRNIGRRHRQTIGRARAGRPGPVRDRTVLAVQRASREEVLKDSLVRFFHPDDVAEQRRRWEGTRQRRPVR